MYYFRISDIHLADNSRQNILSKTENLLVHCESSAVQFIFVLGLFCTFKFQKNSCTCTSIVIYNSYYFTPNQFPLLCKDKRKYIIWTITG